MMRECKKCGETKPLDMFVKHKQCKEGRAYTCQACETKRISDKRRNNKLKAIEYKGGCCSSCGGVFSPAVYDFHHVDKAAKHKDPGQMMGCKWETLAAELDKCVLLCANCHRMEHANEEWI